MSSDKEFKKRIEFGSAEIQKYLEYRELELHGQGKELRGPCPIHRGEHDNFALNRETGEWYCHSTCGRGGSLIQLHMELTRMSFRARAEVFSILGRPQSNGDCRKGRIEAAYDYTDEEGKLLFQNVRYQPKKFKLRQPDGAGNWIWNIRGVRRVLYRLSKFKDAELVILLEGEKDVLNLEQLGFVATTNPMGAGHWLPEYSDTLAGKDIVIFPDTDEDGTGQKHAEKVRRSLQGKARSVVIAEVGHGKDVSEWIAGGATRESIEAAIKTARAKAAEAPIFRANLPVQSKDPPKPKFHKDEGGLLLGYSEGDLGNAERFLQRHQQDVRYCIDQDVWFYFDGRRWRTKADKQVRRLVHDVLKQMAHDAIEYQSPDREIYRKLTSQFHQSSKINSALNEAMPYVQVVSEEFDRQTHLMNFRNGTVDLKTGKLRPHQREDMLTRVLACDYKGPR
jgi:DNA primase